ncbi:protein of unknown function DUF214 [Flexistipes sinusarabici DSM 4947]|uniref:ABC transporter permease n=1 Tax=Flexistipes sinusarabici (strain ATCC 49648 / DSM 4947 / MAS 10) TaxID=717231 RepID=F8E9U4_FLESM|nr:FtsX-like permease family protein [Flexistipes sinusarabici]AEI14277.1 protein of unknown function DUF214 [Flexistipes sinusarabici DSM 4947]
METEDLRVKLENIIIRNLTVRKFKTFLSIICILTAVASIFSVYKISTKLENEVSKSFDEIGANLVITPDYKNKAVLTADDIIKINSIKNKENVAVIAPKLIKSLEVNGNTVPVVGVDFPYELQLNKKLWKLRGEKPSAVNDAVAGAAVAEELNLTTGDTVNIQGKRFNIKAVLEPTGTADDRIMFVNLLTLQQLAGSKYQLNLIEVAAYCFTCPLPQISSQIQNKLPYANVFKVSDALKTREATVEKFSLYSRVIEGFIIITVSFLLFLINISLVNERMKEFGILRALGYRKFQIIEMLLSENIIKGLAGAVSGYLLAVYTAKLWLSNLQIFSVTTSFNISELFIACVFSYLIVVMSSIIPAFRAARVDPLVVINE